MKNIPFFKSCRTKTGNYPKSCRKYRKKTKIPKRFFQFGKEYFEEQILKDLAQDGLYAKIYKSLHLFKKTACAECGIAFYDSKKNIFSKEECKAQS